MQVSQCASELSRVMRTLGLAAIGLTVGVVPAFAGKHEGEWHRHTIAAGVGNHFGWAGVGYTYRPTELVAIQGGVGYTGVAISGRYHPLSWKPFYAGAGLSPIVVDDFWGTVYGPDAQIGIDLRSTHFNFNAGLGLGVTSLPLVGLHFTPTIDLGIGYNFHKPQDADAAIEEQ